MRRTLTTQTAAMRPRFRNSGHAGLVLGFRSGLEAEVFDALKKRLGDGAVKYEPFKLRYTVPSREATYTPDFVLPNGIVVETKGHFAAADRQKHLLLAKQHPDLDVRFLFSRATSRIYSGSTTTCAEWCAKHGFLFAQGRVPEDWLADDGRGEARWAAIERAMAK